MTKPIICLIDDIPEFLAMFQPNLEHRYGEGYVRFALTQPEERIREALERIEKLLN